MSVTHAKGFRAAGVAAGVKPSGKPDVALLVSDRPATAAGCFTTNAFAAAPVEVSRRRLAAAGAAGRFRAVVVNAGNANACTGPRGLADAEAMCAAAASASACPAGEVLVASTGVIGVHLPMDRVLAGIAAAGRALAADGGAAAAEAITTTDTHPKTAAAVRTVGGREVRVGGMAKGAGMIHPATAPAVAHATLLSFVTTDAAVAPADLSNLLTRGVARSFNAITIDGDTSTNDTVILIANGASEVRAEGAALEALGEALDEVLGALARMVAFDGEGATKAVEIVVTGAKSDAEAVTVGRTVGRSSLVKCALWGSDPNWGRILCAVGYAGVALDAARVRIAVQGVSLFASGAPANFDREEVRRTLKNREIRVDIELGVGAGRATVWTCDLTPEYVEFNGAYTT